MTLKFQNPTPARCTLLRQQTLNVEWRPGQAQPQGVEVELRVPNFRAFLTWVLHDASVEDADVVYRWFKPANPAGYAANPDRVLVRARLRRQVAADEAVRIKLVMTPGMWAGVELPLAVWTRQPIFHWASKTPGDDLPVLAEPASTGSVPLVAGVVERLAVRSAPAADDAGVVLTRLVPEDRFGNPAVFKSPVTVRVTWNGGSRELPVRQTIAIELDPPREAVGRCVASVAMADLAPEENIGNAATVGDRLTVTGNPVWRDLPEGLRPAFGELHWHTELSGDGARPLAEALRCAREELALDFASPGDHSPFGDKWEQTTSALQEAHDPGRFATLFSWEYSHRVGHENYYFTDPDHPVKPDLDGYRGGRGDEVADTLRGHAGFFAVPHHTNATAETRRAEDNAPAWHAYPWTDPARQPYVRLAEIFQTRGNMERETADDAWRLWHQRNGASVQSALDRGYRIGFTGGTDNHVGWPARIMPELGEGGGRIPTCSHAVTGVWTASVDRQPLFDALHQRQTWACWDTRALVWFTVNDTPQGHELKVTAQTKLTASIRLSAESVLQTLELVGNGGQIVWQSAHHILDVSETIQLGAANTFDYLYMRGLLRDGGIIYSSPVFILRQL